jgi:hypothetical protein
MYAGQVPFFKNMFERRVIAMPLIRPPLWKGRINHVFTATIVCLLVILRVELRCGGGQRPK